MRTAKLFTGSFTIECPHCKARVGGVQGARQFRAGEVEAGAVLICDKELCKKEFRLPTTLRAAAMTLDEREAARDLAGRAEQ